MSDLIIIPQPAIVAQAILLPFGIIHICDEHEDSAFLEAVR